MKKATKAKPDPDMLPEYDFSQGVRGKYAQRYAEGTNIAVLSPDVAEFFPDSEAVNAALRILVEHRTQEREAGGRLSRGIKAHIAQSREYSIIDVFREGIIHAFRTYVHCEAAQLPLSSRPSAGLMYQERPLNLPHSMPAPRTFRSCLPSSQSDRSIVRLSRRLPARSGSERSFSRCTTASPTKASPSTTSCSSRAIPICFRTRSTPGRN